MALKSKKDRDAAKKETVENTEETVENTEETTPTPKAEEKQVVKKETSTGVPVEAGKSSVFITNPAFVDAVADAEYGVFPSIVASGGSHMLNTEDEKVELGKEIQFQAIVQKKVWKVVPGSSDDESKDYFKVSHDGETTTEGNCIKAALEEAIEAGYDKASIKEYLDVICILVNCEDEDYIGETVTLSLAPSSIRSWSKVAGRCKMKAALGKLSAQAIAGDPELGSAVVFDSIAKNVSTKGGQSYTKFEFSV